MICFVEYLIFRELHHQLKISYKVRGESAQSDSKNSLIKMARLQELFIVLHSIKRAYYQAWRDNEARDY
jgi:hypothetical protein